MLVINYLSAFVAVDEEGDTLTPICKCWD